MIPELSQLLGSAWGIAAIVVLFGSSIFVHELGHFLAARKRGLHVERFSIGFGPKLFGWTRDGVDYRVSLLPLGGYVALPQLADMRGIEGESDAQGLPPISYASKMIVAVMGAVFNILFALFLATLIWILGYPTTDIEQSTGVGYLQDEVEIADGERVPSPAIVGGLQLGDTILAVDGSPVGNWNEMRQLLVSGTGSEADGRRSTLLSVERDGRIIQLTIHPVISSDTGFRHLGMGPATPVVIGSFFEDPKSPARQAGLKPLDTIVAIDGQRLYSPSQMREELTRRVGQTATFLIERDGETFERRIPIAEVAITNQGDTLATIGISRFHYERRIIHPNPFKQVARHVSMTFNTLYALAHPKSDINLSAMSGPPGIARLFYETSRIDLRIALWFTVLVNISLAIFNLLPIPVLDGGHMVFATIGKLRKKPLPPNMVASLQGTFMLLLFGLMIYVSANDISRWVSDANREASRIEYISPDFSQPNMDRAAEAPTDADHVR